MLALMAILCTGGADALFRDSKRKVGLDPFLPCAAMCSSVSLRLAFGKLKCATWSMNK